MGKSRTNQKARAQKRAKQAQQAQEVKEAQEGKEAKEEIEENEEEKEYGGDKVDKEKSFTYLFPKAHSIGLAELLDQHHFVDMELQFPDGEGIWVRRVLLAAASDVLRAKFTADFKGQSARTWSPNFGSRRCWRWLVDWIYGKTDPLPSDLLIEMIVLGDQLQIISLVESLTSLSVHDIAADVARQLLDVSAMPDVLTKIAHQCLPSLAFDQTVLAKLQAADLSTVALVVAHADVCCEAERMKLLGLCLRRPGADPRPFAECLYPCIDWQDFTAEVLEAGIRGNFKYFEGLLGQDVENTENLYSILLRALSSRCQSLEKKNYVTRFHARLPVDVPPPPAPETGIFALLMDQGCNPDVSMSSESQFHEVGKSDLFALEISGLRSTAEQSQSNEPWIEVHTGTFSICPLAVGFKHCLEDNTDSCKTFVVEAKRRDDEWQLLLEWSNAAMHRFGTVCHGMEAATDKYYNRFRIRMTGPNHSGRWILMISWFEVYGTVSTDILNLLA